MAKAGIFWNWASISSGRSCWAGCWMCISAGPATAPGTPKYFDWLVLLKFCTAFEPYTKLYTASIRPQKIAEFLLFDPEFPHSIRFSVDRVTDALARVAPGAPPARRAAVERLAGPAEGRRGFRPDRRIDVGRHRRLSRRHHPAMRKDPRDVCIASYITYGAETVSAWRLMFYSIRHVTRFRYSAPVRESVMELRMQPRSEGPQTLRTFQIATNPRAQLYAYTDHLGNAVYHFNLLREHEELRIEAQAVVELGAFPPCAGQAAMSWNGAATTITI